MLLHIILQLDFAYGIAALLAALPALVHQPELVVLDGAKGDEACVDPLIVWCVAFPVVHICGCQNAPSPASLWLSAHTQRGGAMVVMYC